MRLAALIIFAMILQHNVQAQENTLRKARHLYQYASAEEDSALGLFGLLTQPSSGSQPVLHAYRGAAFSIKASYLWNPISKLDHFNVGKGMIEEAVKQQPENWEIRYVRFTVQDGSPGFLGYRGNISEDKAVLLRSIPAALRSASDAWIAKQAALYLIQSESVTAAEKAKLKLIINY